MRTHLAQHGRRVRLGQIWRSNDPRRFRGVRVVGVTSSEASETVVHCEDLTTKRPTIILLRSFTVGTRGWSLEKETA